MSGYGLALALVFRHRIADVVDIEAQGLGQVVEALQTQAREGFHHGDTPWPGHGRQVRRVSYKGPRWIG